ncbi:hypothetical protein [Pseudobacteroides cellulosolvens]|uniref:Uncharacterized protein n=1 Tax=Pseudobacteroides cellulosolvens ATCC 35603 = DSM 2933 TaxID=398512 RepID=A0A0L6JHA0_9FIRM|nr:hypothetical protein [Pseudobacteroides cellulosolvens]KNY25104.1 hypothetical protein Bccel_0361 [Pseudobacteroides cellulosolvens ATCC 35603 = DSM 2933]
MTNLIIVVIIYILVFGNDKFKEKARSLLPVILGILLVLFTAAALILRSYNYLLSNSTDFLLIVVIFILVFDVQKFSAKNKIAVVGIVGGILLCYLLQKLYYLKVYLAISDWKNIIDGVGLVLGIFLVLFMINSFIRKNK